MTYAPQLALLVEDAPDGPDWLHEIKYDGYRIGCLVNGGRVRLISRNGKDWSASFPEIREAAKALGVGDAIIDGEVAIAGPDGRTSFQALQNAAGSGSRAGLVYFVFDLLRLDGQDLTAEPLEARKARLQRLIAGAGARAPRIHYAEHVVGNGPAFLKQACAHKLEGIVSKRRDAPYRPGRSDAWRKTKCVGNQEFVIGGFTDPEGSRQGLGALLVGYYAPDGRLRFSGKVGTGFTQKAAQDLRLRLESLEQPGSPFDPKPPGALGRRAHWVRPELVGQVEFTEWTADGHLRHPAFQGLRLDKPAREVRLEGPTDERAPKARPAAQPGPRTPASSRKSGTRSSAGVEVAGVALTHPDRVLFPDTALTKLDLARYYETIASWILPQVRGRPLTLVRCPNGVPGSCFYMKHARVAAAGALRRVRIPEKKKVGEYLVADTLAAVVALVQMNVLELHTWNATFERIERPDRLVFDIDPGPDVSWGQVVSAARAVREVLQALELISFVKTTGGKGLHVVVPLVPDRGWDDCLDFACGVAEALARQDPDRYTTGFRKAGRERKILIDYLRNNRGNTSVAAYSARARAGAPVSTPVTWEEVTPRLKPGRFTVETLPGRLARLPRDPWHDYGRTRQRISRSALAAVKNGVRVLL
jgi:bifunctional non-homologous end joining protein LigD